MSSDKQETSIGDQRKAIERYAKENGYRIVGEYTDEGISGDATEKRLEFQRMIGDCSSGRFKIVLCWDQDRFGRFDPLEAGYWIKPMRDARVQLVTVSQGLVDWDDFAGRIVYSVTQEGKHAYLRDLSRNVLRGKLEAAKRGDWGGKAPIGYVIENKRLTLGDPAEVQLVKNIFTWYLAGDSIRGITRRLNELGKSTREGTAWIPSTIQHILKRVTYTGTFKWNERQNGKYNRIADGKVCDSNGNGAQVDDWIVIPNNHPAIIDQEAFDAVQRRLTECKKRTTPHANGGKFLLTGLVRCGKCGGTMFGTIPHKGQAVSNICSTEHSTGKCDRNAARQDELLSHVVNAVVDRFSNPDVGNRLRNELYERVKATTHKTNPKAIGKQLATVDNKLTKAKRRLVEVDADMIPIVSEHIRELTTKKDEVQASLKAAQTPTRARLADVDVRVRRAMELYSGLRETLENADTLRLRELLSQTIDKIEVWSNPVMRGRRRVFQLDRGVIHLRGDELRKLSHSTRPTPQAYHARR